MSLGVPVWLGCRGRHISAFPFTWALSQLHTELTAHGALGPGRAGKLASLPDQPHTVQQSRNDKGGAHVVAMQCCSRALACMTFQLILKHGPWEERSGGKEEKQWPPH